MKAQTLEQCHNGCGLDEVCDRPRSQNQVKVECSLKNSGLKT